MLKLVQLHGAIAVLVNLLHDGVDFIRRGARAHRGQGLRALDFVQRAAVVRIPQVEPGLDVLRELFGVCRILVQGSRNVVWSA